MSNSKNILEEVRANIKIKNSCKLHNITPPEELKLGHVFTCNNCGAKIRTNEIGSYIRGYQAAGGDCNDIYEGWDK